VSTGLLALRKTELQRRTVELPDEVNAWKTIVEQQVDMNLHWSQILAIKNLIDAYAKAYNDILAALPPETDKPGYELGLYNLLTAIASAQRAWDFFRTKFELRNSDRFKRRLRVADIIAIDCYDAMMKVGIQNAWIAADAVREPPLTYLSPDISPMTWARGTRPNDGRTEELEGKTLPIPVVEIPYDHLANIWEFLAISHEVGHEIDADFKLLPSIKSNLTQAFKPTIVAPERCRRWIGWTSEIFADLLGLQLSGPAFADMLRNVLILPVNTVTNIVLGDVHPNHYLRIILCAGYIRTMADAATSAGDAAFALRLHDHAENLQSDWIDLYGTPAALNDYLADIPIVIAGIMDTPIDGLKGATLRSVVAYTQQQDADIASAAQNLQQGMTPLFAIAPRHAIAATRMAISAAMGQGTLAAQIDGITNAAMKLVENNAVRGMRAAADPLAGTPAGRLKRAAAFVADTLSAESPLHQRMMDPLS
jgi:hypothetical protein